jgi:hypothetical protein
VQLAEYSLEAKEIVAEAEVALDTGINCSREKVYVLSTSDPAQPKFEESLNYQLPIQATMRRYPVRAALESRSAAALRKWVSAVPSQSSQ